MGRSPLRARRIFIEANGDAPWPCSFCDELVISIGRKTGHVHHLDEDVENDTAENLAVAHPRCHMRHHQAGRPHSPKHNAKVGARHRGRVLSPEWRAKIGNAHRGRKLSEAHRAKLRKPIPRTACEICGASCALNWIERHRRTHAA